MESPNCQKWSDVVFDIYERKIELPALVEVDSVNTNDLSRISKGDQLLVNDVTVDEIKLCASPYDNGAFSQYRADEFISLPQNFPGKLRTCPYYTSDHVFKSVKNILDIFPFVGDLIFPTSALKVDNVMIGDWERLQVIRKIVTTHTEALEVLVLRNKRKVIIPDDCKVEFMQVENDPVKGLISPSKRGYSIAELLNYQTAATTPMKVQLIIEEEEEEKVESHKPPQRICKKLIHKLKKSKNEQRPPVVEKKPIDPSYAIFPKRWWHKVLLLEPVLIANVTNPMDPQHSFNLNGNLNIKVVVQALHENHVEEKTIDDVKDKLDKHRPSIPLKKLSIEDYFMKGQNNAIVAVVMSGGSQSSSRQQGILAFGHMIALHGICKTNKLLVESGKGSNFLVSACYQGNITTLPNIFEQAGEVPTDSNVTYLVQMTSHPVLKQLDSCHVGEYVQFLKKSDFRISSTRTIQVVHCLVSRTLGGAQKSAIYPMNLRGQFLQIVDEKDTCYQVGEIFKKTLPFTFCVDEADPTLGYDPMLSKKRIVAKQFITETTIVVEMVSKTNDVIKGRDMFLELALNRGSLLLRNIPTKYNTDDQGVEAYPVKNYANRFQKLPCVEMLSGCDVTDLQEAMKRKTNSDQTSPQQCEQEGVTVYKQEDIKSVSPVNRLPNYEASQQYNTRNPPIYSVTDKNNKGLKQNRTNQRSSYDDVVPSQRVSIAGQDPYEYSQADSTNLNMINGGETSKPVSREGSIFEGPCSLSRRTESNVSDFSVGSCDSSGNRPIPKPRSNRKDNKKSPLILKKQNSDLERITNNNNNFYNQNKVNNEIGLQS